MEKHELEMLEVLLGFGDHAGEAIVHGLLEERLREIDARMAKLEGVRVLLDDAIARVDKLLDPVKAQATGLACTLTAMDAATPDAMTVAWGNAVEALRKTRDAEIPY